MDIFGELRNYHENKPKHYFLNFICEIGIQKILINWEAWKKENTG